MVRNTVRPTNPGTIQQKHISTLHAYTDLPLISRALRQHCLSYTEIPIYYISPRLQSKSCTRTHHKRWTGYAELEATLTLFPHEISWNLLHFTNLNLAIPLTLTDLIHNGLSPGRISLRNITHTALSGLKEICWHVTFPCFGYVLK